MLLQNPWIGYVSRNYTTIKNSIIGKMRVLTPEIKDYRDSNPLIILLNIVAGITETLHYYLDNMAREAFVSTARRYSSVVKLSKLVDYRIKTSTSSSCTVYITFKDALGNPVILTSDYVIPINTVFLTTTGIPFTNTEIVHIPSGSSSGAFTAYQRTYYPAGINYQSTGLPNQSYLLGADYVEGSDTVLVGSTLWDFVESFGRSLSTDKHYTIEVREDGLAYLVFGDGTFGAIPGNTLPITGGLARCLGSNGDILANTLTIPKTPLAIPTQTPTISSITITNPLGSTGGVGYETLTQLKKNIPLSLRTLDRAVTKQDHVDIAEMYNGVSRAYVDFTCGKDIYVYIYPTLGGYADTGLRDLVKLYMDDRKMVTSFIHIKSAGESHIMLDLEVTNRFRVPAAASQSDIISVLTREYSRTNSTINRAVRTSDIIALVDNLEKVDYLKLKGIYLRPFPFPLDSNDSLLYFGLNSGVTVLSTNSTKQTWKLRYEQNGGSPRFRVYQNNAPLSTYLTYGVSFISLFTNAGINFTLYAPTVPYQDGSTWQFVAYAYNQDIVIDDFSIPVIDTSDIINTLTIHENFYLGN